MKKILSLLMLLVAIVTGAQAATTYYTPANDEVIILNDVYSSTATTAGYSSHPAIVWYSASANTASKKAGDPANGGEQTSSTVTCYQVKNNGAGKQIDVNITGVSKLIVYRESTKYPLTLLDNNNSSAVLATGEANVLYSEFTLDGTKNYSIRLQGNTTSSKQDVNVYAIKLIKVAGPTITTQPKNAEYLIGSTTYPSMNVEAEASEGTLSYQWELSTDGETFKAISTDYVPSAATATLLGSEALDVLAIDEPTTYYFRCKVTDSNRDVYTDVATLNVIDDAPTITTDLETAYDVIKGKTLELSIVAACFFLPVVS